RGPAPAGGSRRVSVRRAGGFAGLRAAGEIDLDAEDPRTAEVASLVDRIDLGVVSADDPKPDRYIYSFDLCGSCAAVPEQHLTPELARLVELLLD
ncbi:protealysin inhibitor emfourin, partial [Nocardioides sp.]|uniref:protealysin inhibitor emfourin n=1 Tax=Nocardioides sp. TaxID=35761 RepID=UPI002ED9219A